MPNLFARAVFVAAAFATICLAQSSLVLSPASTLPGGTAVMSLSLSAQPATSPAGLQWTLAPSTSITALSVVASPAIAAAGKSIQCAGAGTALTCLLYGLNGAPIPGGPVAVIHATVASDAVSGTVGLSNTLGGSAAGDPMAVSATGGAIAITRPVVNGLSCAVTGLATGAATACTITLNAPAPSGAIVQLHSDTASLIVPATVPVVPGLAGATFTASAGAISSDQNATITATLDGVSAAAAGLVLTAPALSLAGLQCASGTLLPNGQTTCTATLTRAAPAGGITVSLRSSTPDLAVPLSVTVPAGASTTTFVATAGSFAVAQNAVVTASIASVSRTATVALVPPGGLSALACTPMTISPGDGGNCTITLASAVATTTIIAVASTNPGLLAPSTVSISSGLTTATFAFTTTTTLSGWVIVSASLGGTKKTLAFTLAAATPSLTGLAEQPATAVDLTAAGLSDWAHWGLNTATDFDHKAAGAFQISNFAVIGGAIPGRYSNNPTAYAWTDGAPNGISTGTNAGVYVAGQGNGFRITVPASTTLLTLRVYVGAWNGQGRIVAHLSDGSAADFVDTSLVSDPYKTKLAAYTFTYQAASAGQTLTITYTQESATGNVTLQAATLRN